MTTLTFYLTFTIALAAVIYLFSLPSRDFSNVLYWLEIAGVWAFLWWGFKDSIQRFCRILFPASTNQPEHNQMETIEDHGSIAN